MNPSRPILLRCQLVTTRRFTRHLVGFLVLIGTLLLLAFISAPLTTAQETPGAAKPVAAPSVRSTAVVQPVQPLLPRQVRPRRRVASEASIPAAPKTDVIAVPVATPAAQAPIAAEPKASEGRLPFMAANEPENHEQPPSTVGLLLRTLGALLLIVGLIVVVAYGMKRFGGARFGTPSEDAPSLAVLTSLSLGERRSLAIVRFGDRTLLLGSTAHAVTLLAEAESDAFAQPRSVAEILSDEQSNDFSQEFLSVTKQLDEEA